MLEAVPWNIVSVGAAGFRPGEETVRILQPTSWQLERLDPWELKGMRLVRCFEVEVEGYDGLRMMSEIIEVPFPLAASRRLMSFLTFQISIYCGRGQPLLWFCCI